MEEGENKEAVERRERERERRGIGTVQRRIEVVEKESGHGGKEGRKEERKE